MTDKSGLDRADELVNLPLWNESLTWLENLRLKASLVYYGFGIPHGDQSPVIVVPGFLVTDLYLVELRFWLGRIGYSALKSEIGINAECPDVLANRLRDTVIESYEQHQRPVHLIGHSLGGVLVRGVANEVPDKVASVITLASPFRRIRVDPFVADVLGYVRRRLASQGRCAHDDCFSMACPCRFGVNLQKKLPSQIHQTAIYTKDDGIVDWRTCITGDPDIDVEVGGTHIGLVWNAEVYRVIAERLAQAASDAKATVKAKRRK